MSTSRSLVGGSRRNERERAGTAFHRVDCGQHIRCRWPFSCSGLGAGGWRSSRRSQPAKFTHPSRDLGSVHLACSTRTLGLFGYRRCGWAVGIPPPCSRASPGRLHCSRGAEPLSWCSCSATSSPRAVCSRAAVIGFYYGTAGVRTRRPVLLGRVSAGVGSAGRSPRLGSRVCPSIDRIRGSWRDAPSSGSVADYSH